MLSKPVFTFFLAAVSFMIGTEAHKAISCFDESTLQGGANENTEALSDLNLLLSIEELHVMTSIKVCTDRSVSLVKGVQISYGIFNGDGEIESAVRMNPIGDTDHSTSLCTVFYIPQGEKIVTLIYRFSEAGITQLWLTTNGGTSSSYGKTSADE